MGKRHLISQWICMALAFALFIIPTYSVSAAGVGISLATDGLNYLSRSADDIKAVTYEGAQIRIEGVASPAGAEVAVQVRGASEGSKTFYVDQKKSDNHGYFTLAFSTEGYEPGTYAVAVNASGAQMPVMRYFRIAPPQVPQGAGDVFDCFTVNGRAVSFDGSKLAFFKVEEDEADTIPVLNVSAADKTAKVTVTPVTKAPCAVKAAVNFEDGSSKVYSLVIGKPGADKRITDLVTVKAAGPTEIEYNIRLGTSVENASLVYTDRANVYWHNASSVIFDGATQIKRAKNDAAGIINDNSNLAGFVKISNKPYYGGAYSGQNGEPYWMSFKVHADATVFMANNTGQPWPNNDGTWRNDSPYIVSHGSGGASARGTGLYYKKVKAGDTVNIPNFGVPKNWPTGDNVYYDPPAYVVVWDDKGTIAGTDADISSVSYSINGTERTQYTDFRKDLDTYTIQLEKDAEQIEFYVEISDEKAKVYSDTSSVINLTGREMKKEFRVVSEGGIVEKTYTFIIKRDYLYYGDVNGDGEADITDATLIMRYSVGLDTPFGCIWDAGDVNGDGKADITDATFIMRYSVGLPNPPNVVIGEK